MTDPLLKNHADMMLAVEAGYDYAPNIAQDMADHIKQLQAEVNGAHEIILSERAEVLRLRERIKELEAERDAAYETAVREAAAQAMKWLDDPDDDASLSGYILSLIGEDDE